MCPGADRTDFGVEQQGGTAPGVRRDFCVWEPPRILLRDALSL